MSVSKCWKRKPYKVDTWLNYLQIIKLFRDEDKTPTNVNSKVFIFAWVGQSPIRPAFMGCLVGSGAGLGGEWGGLDAHTWGGTRNEVKKPEKKPADHFRSEKQRQFSRHNLVFSLKGLCWPLQSRVLPCEKAPRKGTGRSQDRGCRKVSQGVSERTWERRADDVTGWQGVLGGKCGWSRWKERSGESTWAAEPGSPGGSPALWRHRVYTEEHGIQSRPNALV